MAASNFLYPERPIKKEYAKDYDIDGRPQSDLKWWLQPPDKLYNSVFSVCNTVETSLQTWRHQCRVYRHLYGNPEAFFVPQAPSSKMSPEAMSSRKVQLNVVQSCVDTVGSMIAKNRPQPMFITQGEDDYAMQERAKLLNKYILGIFDNCGEYGSNIYQIARRVFLDAAIIGTGALKIWACEEDKKIKMEWIFPDELIIDNMEGMKEQPGQIHRRKFIPRDTLLHQFPEHKEKILTCSTISNVYNTTTQTVADLVETIESWKLPSGSKAKDGKHSICVDNCTLLDEPYEKNFFPIVFFRWADRPFGFWGRGIAEELTSLQMRINVLLRDIQIAQERMAFPTIFMESGSMVQGDHIISNEIGSIVEYTGNPPICITPTAMQQEIYQHVEWLVQECYQITGISQANASGTKPPEVKSGTAIEMVADIASGRFELISQEWEYFFLRIAKVCVSLSKDLYTKLDKKLSVKSIDNKFIQEIHWSEVDLDEDEFKIQCFPISGLPNTPAGRMDRLDQYVQSGWIDKDFAMQLINFPDLEEYTNLETAPLELIRKILSRIVNKGIYMPPSPYLPNDLCLQLGTLELCRAEMNGVPEEKLQLLRNWIDDTNAIAAQNAPPPQAQPLPGASPSATPGSAQSTLPPQAQDQSPQQDQPPING